MRKYLYDTLLSLYFLYNTGLGQPTHNSVDHFICVPNNSSSSNNNGHLTDASDHIYAGVNTSEGPQRARVLRSSSNRDSSGSVISSSSIVSSNDPHQRRSASISSASANIAIQHIGANKLAPHLIDLIPPPPAYPPPASIGKPTIALKPLASFSSQSSLQDITPKG